MVSSKTPEVFISHTHADSAFVNKLAQELDSRGLKVWSADQHLKPGDHWAEVIEEGIHDAENVLVVLSENSANSDWVRAETALALTQEGKRIVPIFSKRNTDVPFMLRAFQGVDLSDPKAYPHSLDKLADLLLKERPPREFNFHNDNRARLLKVRLEAVALQQEKLSLDHATKLKVRALAISLAFVCASVTVTGAIMVAASVLAVDVLDAPLAAVTAVGTVAGILAGSFVSFLISRARHSVKADE